MKKFNYWYDEEDDSAYTICPLCSSKEIVKNKLRFSGKPNVLEEYTCKNGHKYETVIHITEINEEYIEAGLRGELSSSYYV